MCSELGNDVEIQATKPLEVVHLDVCGLMGNMYVGGGSILLLSLLNFH